MIDFSNGIAPHIDRPDLFDDTIVCLSLGSDIIMNFEKVDTIIPILLEKRSLVIIRGESRYLWKHGIKWTRQRLKKILLMVKEFREPKE